VGLVTSLHGQDFYRQLGICKGVNSVDSGGQEIHRIMQNPPKPPEPFAVEHISDIRRIGRCFMKEQQ